MDQYRKRYVIYLYFNSIYILQLAQDTYTTFLSDKMLATPNQRKGVGEKKFRKQCLYMYRSIQFSVEFICDLVDPNANHREESKPIWN
jgi:hypothetical protein